MTNNATHNDVNLTSTIGGQETCVHIHTDRTFQGIFRNTFISEASPDRNEFNQTLAHITKQFDN